MGNYMILPIYTASKTLPSGWKSVPGVYSMVYTHTKFPSKQYIFKVSVDCIPGNAIMFKSLAILYLLLYMYIYD